MPAPYCVTSLRRLEQSSLGSAITSSFKHPPLFPISNSPSISQKMPSTKPKTKSTAKAAPKPRQTYAEWLDAVARMNPYIANEAAKTPPKTDANGIHWLNIDHIYDSLRQQAIRDYPPGSRMLREVLAEVRTSLIVRSAVDGALQADVRDRSIYKLVVTISLARWPESHSISFQAGQRNSARRRNCVDWTHMRRLRRKRRRASRVGRFLRLSLDRRGVMYCGREVAQVHRRRSLREAGVLDGHGPILSNKIAVAISLTFGHRARVLQFRGYMVKVGIH
jgi:hypothetical protein